MFLCIWYGNLRSNHTSVPPVRPNFSTHGYPSAHALYSSPISTNTLNLLTHRLHIERNIKPIVNCSRHLTCGKFLILHTKPHQIVVHAICPGPDIFLHSRTTEFLQLLAYSIAANMSAVFLSHLRPDVLVLESLHRPSVHVLLLTSLQPFLRGFLGRSAGAMASFSSFRRFQ